MQPPVVVPPVVVPPQVNGTDAPPVPPPVVVPIPDLSCPSPTIVVEPGGSGGGLHNLTDAGDATKPIINVAGLATSGGPPLDGSESSTVTFPPLNTTVITSFATVSFPPGVTASYVPAGGQLALRVSADVPGDARVQDALAYEGSGRVSPQRIVEVGGSTQIAFDMPVRILLDGQAGARAFYIGSAGGAITPIDGACAADDTARVHRQMGGAGECQMDSVDGGKIIYTYHLTRFGTVLSESGAQPPAIHECSVRIAHTSLSVEVRPGRPSSSAPQTVTNSGSLAFDRLELEATPWYIDLGGAQPGPGARSLPASITGVSEDGKGGIYRPVAENGTYAATGAALGGGQEASLWFRMSLAGHDQLKSGELVQYVTYVAECASPPGRQ